jgi:RimJ/RimL family protein N-acetyltransferase
MSQLQAAQLGPFLTERLKHATQALVELPDDVFLVDPELAVQQLVDQFSYAELIVSDRAEVEPNGTPFAHPTDHYPLFSAEWDDVSLRIPFSGPAELWAYWPSRWPSHRFAAPSYTDVELRDGYFRFVVRCRDAGRDEALGGVGLVIDRLQTTASWINIEVRIWLAELSFRLGRAASARRSILAP